MPRPSKLYLAYGSNLAKAQMRRRCPSARALGTIMLNDAQLVFRGVADVVYKKGSQVPVAVWRIYREDEDALDRFEGVRSGYYSKEMVELDDGQEALLYVKNDHGVYPPSQAYYDLIRQGYRDFGLDIAYLEKALAESYVRKDPSEETDRRRAKQRRNAQHYKLATMPQGIGEKVKSRVIELEAKRKAEIEKLTEDEINDLIDEDEEEASRQGFINLA